MSTKVAIIVEDFSTWGGVEIVTNHLVNTDLPIWGIIGLRQSKEVLTIPYPQHIELHTQSDTDKIIQLLKDNNITHIIIQIYNLKQAYDLIIKAREQNIKSIYFLHNTPYLLIEKFSYKEINKIRKIKKLIVYKIATFISYKAENKTISYKDKIINKFFIRFFSSYKFRFGKISLENIISSCDKFLVLSENIVKECKSFIYKKYHHKIDFIHNIIPLKFHKNPFINKTNSIVFAGRLIWYKGVIITVETLTPLMKKYSNWDFYILGDGEEFEIIQKYIQENNLTNIHLVGKVDNVYSYLEKSKICILYSLFEGLPTILLEAGYFNNVLISYNSKGGVSDIIEDKKNGFIVNHTHELYEKVEFLINHPDKIEEMALNNNIVFEKFDNEKTISKWKSILK